MSSNPTYKKKRVDAQGPRPLLDSLGQRFQTKWFQTTEMGALSTELEQATGKREMGNPWPSEKQGHRWWERRMAALVLGRGCVVGDRRSYRPGGWEVARLQTAGKAVLGALQTTGKQRFSGCV